jgi:hypothetical protein
MESKRANSLEKPLRRFEMKATSKAIESGTLSRMPWTTASVGLSHG